MKWNLSDVTNDPPSKKLNFDFILKMAQATNSKDIIQFCENKGVSPELIAEICDKQIDFSKKYQSKAADYDLQAL
jgi:hypothetical protein